MKSVRKPRVRVAVASPEPLRARSAQSIGALVACPEFDFDFREPGSSSQVQNKNLSAKDLDADYLLFVDPGLVFSLDDFMLLMASDKEVVCGAYLAGPDRIPSAGYRRVGTDERGLHPVDWVGMGFTLIKRAVFESMPYPYFAMPVVHDGEEPLSEDLYFCRKTGREVFLHHDVQARFLPAETRVSLPDEDWAVVLKAVLAYPMPFEKAGGLLKTMRGHFRGKGAGIPPPNPGPERVPAGR